MRPGLIDGLGPALFLALTAIACGGSVAGSSAHDGGTGDGAAIDAPPEATSTDSGSIADAGTPDAPACSTGDASCNALKACGPVVTLVDATTLAPQPAGGTIADGTYVLTAMTFYPTGTQTITVRPLRQTFGSTGSGTGMLMVQEISEQPPSGAVTFTWTVTVQPPSTLAWTSTCGGAASASFGYTAMPSELDLFADTSGFGTVMTTYAKQ